MKFIAPALAILLGAATSPAGPLHKEQVAASAKWLVHLDVDSFLGSQTGGFVAQLFDKDVKKHTEDLNKQFGVKLDLRSIHSVTAYGTEYKMRGEPSGVLMVQSDLPVGNMIEAVMAIFDGTAGTNNPLKKIQTKPFPIYTMHHQVFGTPLKTNLFLISRSRLDLEKGCEVVLGKSANLTSTKTFSAFPEAPNGFVLLGVAEGFIDAPLPPQAKVLKNADGGQIVAGEKADKLFLQLSLSGKDAESATQIQQVLQGLLALASLAQGENQDLQQLSQAAKVSSNDKVVTVNLELPVSTIIDRVNSEHTKSEKKKSAKKRRKPTDDSQKPAEE